MRISDWSSDVCSSDLHVHARPWLQADAAGVEGDALADEHHRRLPRRAAVPAHREQSRRPRRALRDAEQRPHAERFHLPLVEDFELDPQVGEMLAALDEGFGIEEVRRLGDQRLGRSEEHTSELQSLMRISYAVFCLKKKITKVLNITSLRRRILKICRHIQHEQT